MFCCLIVYFVVQIFTNNSGLTCIIAHVSLLSFGFVDYFVYLFRGNEFTFSDIRSIGTGLSVAGNYKLQLNDRGVYVIFLAALFIAFVRKWNVRFTGKIQMRVISVMAIALSCVIIAANAYDVNTETWEQKGTYRNGYLLNYVLGFVTVLFLLRKDIPKIRSKNWRKPINPIKRITAQQMKSKKSDDHCHYE